MTGIELDILVHFLRHVAGRHYDTTPGASKDPTTTDCSRAPYAALVDTFGEHVKAEQKALHLNVDADQPFDNVDAIVRLGIGRIVQEPIPGRMHYMQGWNGLFGGDPRKLRIVKGSKGHTTMWWEAPFPLANECMVLQATPLKPPWVDYRTWAKHSARWNHVKLAVLGPGP